MSISFETAEISVNEIQQLDAASLSKLITELQQSKADLEARRFIETSLAKFADLMRWQSSDSLSSWVERLLAEMAPTVGALQSCMYMTSQKSDLNSVEINKGMNTDIGKEYESAEDTYETDTRELILVGAYAHDEENTLSIIKFGKGLIGQAAKSKRATLFNRNAKIETRTYTGLALLHPQSLIIQPLIYNEIVEGVLEISSVEEFTTQQIDFLRLLSEAIAANLMTIRNQEEMRHLYMAMQTKTESLTAQEEEMRQNMEEMAATQEEMARLRNQAEQQAALQSATIDSFHDGITAIDLNFDIMLFNDVAQKFAENLNLPLVKGKSIKEFYPPESREAQLEKWKRALKGEIFSAEVRLLAPDGQTELIFLYHFFPIQNIKKTGIIGACTLVRNVTEERRKQLEIESLKIKAEKQSNFLQSLLDGMQSGVIAIDKRNNIRLFNKLGAEICMKFGLDIRVGNPFIELIHFKQRDEFLKYIQDALAGKSAQITLFYRFTDNDEGAWFEITFIPITENDGQISGVIVEFENVNVKMLQSLEVETLKNEATSNSVMLQSMVNGIHSGIIKLNLNYEIQLMSDLGKKILESMGYLVKNGESLPEKIREERRELFVSFLKKASEGEAAGIVTPVNIIGHDEQDWLDLSFVPIFETNNIVSGIIIEMRIVTEKIKQQQEIETLNHISVSERNLRQSVINNIDPELIAIDLDYRVTVISKSAQSSFSKFGIPVHIGSQIGEALDPDFREMVLSDWRQAMGGNPVRRLTEYRFSGEDEVQIYDVDYSPIYNDQKTEIEGVVLLFKNVSKSIAEKEQNEKIKEEALIRKSYLNSIFDGYADPMFTIDRDYNLTIFNESAKKYFADLKVELSLGLNISKVFGNRYEHIAKNFRQVFEKGNIISYVEMLNENTDRMLVFEVFYGPISNEKNEVIGAWLYKKNITDLKIRDQLLQSKDKKIREIEEALKNEKSKNNQLQSNSSLTRDDEKNRQFAEKNYAKFKSQIDMLSEQLTYKDNEIKKLKAELEARI